MAIPNPPTGAPPPRRKMRSAKKFGLYFLLIIGVIWFVISVTSVQTSTPTATTAEPAQPTPDNQATDFTQPLYTKSSALVCPPEVAQDPREGYGLEGALADHHSLFSSSHPEKFGCEEVRDGIPVILIGDPMQQIAHGPQDPCYGMIASNIGYVSWCDLRNATAIEKSEQIVEKSRENPANAKYFYCMGIAPPETVRNDVILPTAAECATLMRKSGVPYVPPAQSGSEPQPESEPQTQPAPQATSKPTQPEAQQSAPPEATPATAAMQPFTSAAGRFSVLFPVTPQQSSEQIDLGHGATTTSYMFTASTENIKDLVMYVDCPLGLIGDSPDAFLQMMEKEAILSKSLTLTGEYGFDFNGVPARAFAASDSYGTVYSFQDFLAGTRFYEVGWSTRKGYTAATQATQFMDSFKIF